MAGLAAKGQPGQALPQPETPGQQQDPGVQELIGKAGAAGLFTKAGPAWREILKVGHLGKKNNAQTTGTSQRYFFFFNQYLKLPVTNPKQRTAQT